MLGRTRLRRLEQTLSARDVAPQSPLWVYTIPPKTQIFRNSAYPTATPPPTHTHTRRDAPTPDRFSSTSALLFSYGQLLRVHSSRIPRLALEDHALPFTASSPLSPSAPDGAPLSKPVQATWPKSKKSLKAKTLQDGHAREVSMAPDTGGRESF